MSNFFTVRVANWLLSLLAVSLTTNLQAQVYTRRLSAGETINQYGAFNPDVSVPKSALQGIDTAPLIAEDRQREKLGLPARLGVDIVTPVDLIQATVKSAQTDYQAGAYQFTVAGALGLSVVFDEFHLAEGARVFIYNSDRTLLIGPITAQQNGPGFWSDLIEGPSAIVEVQEPAQTVGQSRIHVSKLVQYYRLAPRFGFGTSGACEINTSCYPDYQTQADGVAMLLTNYSPYTYACTGSIINSTQQDFRSYLLTAFHCYDFSGDGVQSAGELAAAANTQVRFHWESPTCTTAADNSYLTLTGANFRAAYANSDVTLLELTQQVPPSENITYLGWDRGSALPGSPFGIHHPAADVKKISFSPNTTTLVNVTPGETYTVNAGTTHIQVTWAAASNNLGVTEGGSSGSPLFNSNRRIVGQLHGGGSTCTDPTLRDQYGRFFTSWTGGGSSSTRLSNWLDPASRGNLMTDGVKPVLSGPAIVTDAGSFSINTLETSIVSWRIAGGAGVVSTTSGVGNVANVSVLSPSNSLTITFSINAGQTYPIQFSRPFTTAMSCPPASMVAITAQPASSSSVNVGATATIQVATSGPVTAYQWYKGNTSLVNQTSATLTLSNIQLSDAGAYRAVVSGSCNSLTTTTFNLNVVALPDLTPTLYARPLIVNGASQISVAVAIIELNGVSTQQPITVYVTKDPLITLTFDPTATSLTGYSGAVQNSAWTFDGTANSSFYVLTTSTVIQGQSVLSFGLTGLLSPGATQGQLSVSAIVVQDSGGDGKVNNNSDADKIDYFDK